MSTAVVLGTPAEAPPDPSGHPGWDKIRSTWTTWEGHVWNLTEPQMGVFLTKAGVRGLSMPKATHHRDERVTLHGAAWRGWTAKPREVFWPVHLFHDGSSREYVERDELWWRGLRHDKQGTWTVEVPGVSRRHLDLRFLDDGDWAPELDPTFFGWADYGLTLQADQPFWYGDPIPHVFQSGSAVPFFGGTSPGAPIINLGRGDTVANARMRNPGDEPAWVAWKIEGPTTSVSLTLAGKTIQVPFALAEGEYLILDSRPQARTAIDHTGADRYEDLGQIAWGSVPALGETAVEILMVGQGRVSASLVPLYHRAWGTA